MACHHASHVALASAPRTSTGSGALAVRIGPSTIQLENAEVASDKSSDQSAPSTSSRASPACSSHVPHGAHRKRNDPLDTHGRTRTDARARRVRDERDRGRRRCANPEPPIRIPAPRGHPCNSVSSSTRRAASGCHACTVACKSENDVPVGSFRTWVKYTEEGEFPTVKRSFAVLRCNQCTAAPCVTICPVRALDKRSDGIVDVDPAACIGCKGLHAGLPLRRAVHRPREGHGARSATSARTAPSSGLAPACAVVCPTEAIIPGDFDDATSLVSRMRRENASTCARSRRARGPTLCTATSRRRASTRCRRTEPAAASGRTATPASNLAVAGNSRRSREKARARTTYERRAPAAVGLEDHRLPLRQVRSRPAPSSPAVIGDASPAPPPRARAAGRRSWRCRSWPSCSCCHHGRPPGGGPQAPRALPLHPVAPELELVARARAPGP